MDGVILFIKDWWPQALFLIGFAKWIGKQVTTTIKAAERDREAAAAENAAIKDGMLEILRFRLFRECHKCLDVGAKSEDNLEVIDGLHEAYNALGGNHTGDRLYQEAVNLPTVSEAVFEAMYRERHCLHGGKQGK